MKTALLVAFALLASLAAAPARAQQLFKLTASDAAPERGGAWFTLALANYRNGNWQAADDADQNSIKFARGGQANAFDWVLLSMIRAQQDRMDEAREWHTKANDWIAQNNPKDQDLLVLAAEAVELIDTADQNPPTTINTDQQSR